MSKALLARELGSGYGHDASVHFLGEQLSARGLEPVLIAPDEQRAEAAALTGLTTLASPRLGRIRATPPAVGYAELLARVGYLDREELLRRAAEWRGLIAAHRPRLLVVEHAPTALLAVRGLDVPTLAMGPGFTVPPACAPLPSLQPERCPSPDRLLRSERAVLTTVNEVLRTLGAREIGALHELFHSTETLLFTYRELDPFHDYRPTPGPAYLGLPPALPHGGPARWPRAGIGRLFAYLKEDFPALAPFLESLAGCGQNALVHVPGLGSDAARRLCSTTVTVTAEPLAMGEWLETCNAVICHGGHGMTAAALLASCPLVLIPLQLEQRLTARLAAQQGAAVVVGPREPATVYRRALEAVLGNASYTDAACAFAESRAPRSAADLAGTVRTVLEGTM